MTLAVASGILIFLSFPKWNLWFLAWIALVPLFFSVENLSFKKSFLLGWLTGTTAFIGILYWILPTFRAAGVSIGIGFLSLVLLSSYIGLYYGIFASISQKSIKNLPSFFAALSIPAFWTFLEYLRNHLFSGFPWGLLGYSQWKSLPVIQISEWTGVYGVSFSLVASNLLLFAGLKKLHKLKNYSALFLMIFLLAPLWQKSQENSSRGKEKQILVSLLQGNIDQYKKWDAVFVKEILDTYSILSQKATQSISPSLHRSIAQLLSLIVWPETAVPGWLPQQKELVRWIEKTVKKSGSWHLIGAVTEENGKSYNSAFLFDPSGKIVGRYDKIHLVPFGEFVPFQSLLGKWISVLNELGGFESGEKLKILEIPEYLQLPNYPIAQSPNHRVRLGVSICYEAIFPELIRKQVIEGADILVNITNDGWYLDTAAPEQHFAMNVFRAAENRRYLIRAANTGISGIIGPDGLVLNATQLNTRTTLLDLVTPVKKRTFYTKYGDLFAWICCAVSIAGILASFFRLKFVKRSSNNENI